MRLFLRLALRVLLVESGSMSHGLLMTIMRTYLIARTPGLFEATAANLIHALQHIVRKGKNFASCLLPCKQ
jgi:hypothetical protein